LLALETKDDLFKIGDLFVPSENTQIGRKLYKEIDSVYELICKFIEYFKLNEYL
jgi:hypothetical protein